MKVSIIILNYNTSRLTLNCINSIHKYLPNGTYEIIVVDNASQEKQTINTLLKIFPVRKLLLYATK